MYWLLFYIEETTKKWSTLSRNHIIATVLLIALVSTLVRVSSLGYAEAETAQKVGPIYEIDFVTAYPDGDSAQVILKLERTADYGPESSTTLVDVYRIKLLSGGSVIGTQGLAFFSNNHLPMNGNDGISIMGIVFGIPASHSGTGHGPENVGETATTSYGVHFDMQKGSGVVSVIVERLYSLLVTGNSSKRYSIDTVVAEGELAKIADWQITILDNGDITPMDAPIHRSGNIYTLTADTNQPIVVLKNNCVLEGANHTLTGYSNLDGSIAVNLTAYDVTVQNIRIKDWQVGILGAWNNNTIINSELSSHEGISIYGNDYVVRQNKISQCLTGIVIKGGAVRPQGDNNLITENQIIENTIALRMTNSNKTTITRNLIVGKIGSDSKPRTEILSQGAIEWGKPSYNTILYGNNFINCTQKPSPFSPAPQWDNGKLGNYWSDYLTRYPDATEIPNTGVGDTPYVIDKGEADRYPLIEPFYDLLPIQTHIPSTQASSSQPADSFFATVPTIMVAAVALAVIAMVVLFAVKRMRRSSDPILKR